MECQEEEVLPEGCDPSYKPAKEDEGYSLWWILPAALLMVIVIAIGCFVTVVITAQKRDWSFKRNVCSSIHHSDDQT